MAYQIIIKIPVEAMDDIEARQEARKIVFDLTAIYGGLVGKLQEVYEDKPPRGINVT